MMRFRTMRACVAVLLIGSSLSSDPAAARPISYPGGWSLMTMNDFDSHSVHATYSPASDYSIAYLGEYFREEEWQFHGAELSYLLKRWNLPSSQANAYVKAAAGVAYSDHHHFSGETEAAAHTGFAADWEDRRFFISYENELMEAGDIADFYEQTARVGIAPYIGDYGDLHTWVMLQLDHRPEMEGDELTLTPLVRFFKGENLMEVGISTNSDVLFNYTLIF